MPTWEKSLPRRSLSEDTSPEQRPMSKNCHILRAGHQESRLPRTTRVSKPRRAARCGMPANPSGEYILPLAPMYPQQLATIKRLSNPTACRAINNPELGRAMRTASGLDVGKDRKSKQHSREEAGSLVKKGQPPRKLEHKPQVVPQHSCLDCPMNPCIV